MSGCPHVVWALRQRGLSASERVVLIYLADKANGAMVCWPSIQTIATETELSVRTVHSAVHQLEANRLIRIEARKRQVHHYHILRPAEPSKAANSAPKDDVDTANSAYQEPQDLHDNAQELHVADAAEPANPAKFTCKTPQIEPANLAENPPKKEPPKDSPKRETRRRAREPDPPGFAEFYAAYPKKKSPAEAAKAFAQQLEAGAKAEEIMAGLLHHTFNPVYQFIPYPASWLRDKAWKDAPDPPPQEPQYNPANLTGAYQLSRRLQEKERRMAEQSGMLALEERWS